MTINYICFLIFCFLVAFRIGEASKDQLSMPHVIMTIFPVLGAILLFYQEFHQGLH